MAYGIEDIAKMQVTGPVKGGDMVIKPDQAPVGAAALLNKISRKNTPGVFKLPSPDKQMPDFMKVAAMGIGPNDEEISIEERFPEFEPHDSLFSPDLVEDEIAQGDTISIMAGELLRQGFDPIVIKSMDPIRIQELYERTFGSERDADEMASAIQNIRNKAKTVEALAPEGEQLAYINKEEADILKLLGGSGEQEPITGVESFKAMTHQERVDAETKRRAVAGDTSAYVQREMKRLGGGSDSQPGGRAATQEASDAFKAAENKDLHMARAMQDAGFTPTRGGAYDQALQKDITSSDDITDLISASTISDLAGTTNKEAENFFEKYKDKIIAKFGDFKGDVKGQFIDIWNTTGGNVKNIFTGKDDKVTDDDGEETEDQKNWQKYVNTILGGATLPMVMMGGTAKEIGKMLHDFKVTPEKLRDENYLAIMKDKLKGDRLKEFEKEHADIIADAWGARGGTEGFREALASAEAVKGSEAYKRTKPEEYWKDYKGRTMGDMEELSQLSLSGSSPELSRQIIEAREITAKQKQAEEKRTGQGRRYGGGSDLIEEKLEEIVSTTPTDSRAGQFNLGGTMPYTHDVATSGVEMDVPLGRRFAIDKGGKYRGSTGMDLNEAMQYATLGGYGQLEPFQEYLARRRKHLGEDKPQYFDEEGNVIYSETV